MNIENSRRQGGFTLIELVVVIVVLGILAAFAIPRFVDVNSDARASAIRGLGGSISSSIALSHGLALARGEAGPTGDITMEGTVIQLAHGYPVATATVAGQNPVDSTIGNVDGFNITRTATQVTFDNGAADTTTCRVVYTAATGPSAPATVQVTASPTGCQ